MSKFRDIDTALLRRKLFGADGAPRRATAGDLAAAPLDRSEILGGVGTIAVIVLVLGGIWFGWFTPTEAAGVGALLALALALAKGLRFRQIVAAVLETGRMSGPLLFLLLFAQMYSRLLSLAGAVDFIQDSIAGFALVPAATVALMVVIWFLLGMFIDSASILLLSVPIFTPIAMGLGYDPLAFAIITILAIEAGILTPLLGLAVYTVKAALNDDTVSMATIFRGSTPYWITILLTIVIVYLVPDIASYLPGLM